jgi:hypothetical protein
LHQYWFFCFKTAKHWGEGPIIWTAELLEFSQFPSAILPSLPGTPQNSAVPSKPYNSTGPTPSRLCMWYIHVREYSYEQIPEDISTLMEHNSNDDWESWPENGQQPPLHTRLRDGLEHNDFSPTPTADLPVAIPQIAQAAKSSDSELLLESFGFSIMSRNVDQVRDILFQMKKNSVKYASLYPFHLATSFLDGAKTCCNVMTVLSMHIAGAEVHEFYTNEHGHTILDNLMIAIIKSHTSAKPTTVDQNLKDTPRFTGEEVYICGRWDVDSPCVRHLHASGNASIPSNWKHKFCNTSIQTICDCICNMFTHMPPLLLLSTPSGLFIRRCFDCGIKMQLQPLHSLVMTAYHLATQGNNDEDLFGILACALCMISRGFDPCTTAEISVTSLLDTDALLECEHEELTAAGLAERLSFSGAASSQSAKLQLGWAVLAGVLHRCEQAHIEQNNDRGDEEDESDEEDVFNGSTQPSHDVLQIHRTEDNLHNAPCFQRQRDLSTLWASVQAELLSYRRLENGHSWTSERFSMATLQQQLAEGRSLEVGYAKNSLLHAHCACHNFGGFSLALLSEVMDPQLANLDVWGRASYGATMGEFNRCC